MKLAKVIIIFVIGGLAGYWVATTILAPTTTAPEEAGVVEQEGIQASLMIDFGDGTITTCNKVLLEQRTVFNLLQACSEDTENPFELGYEEYPDLGVLITKIGDKEWGGDDKYWQYWVNNEYAPVGVTGYVLEDGDVVEWKFIESQI